MLPSSAPARRQKRRLHPVRRNERGVVLEDRPLQLLQRLTRLEPELVRQEPSGLCVDVESLGLAPAAVERGHELPARPLAQRVLGDERLELAHEIRMAAEYEVCVDPVLEDCESALVEPGYLRLREIRVAKVCESGATPERERLGKRR